jgi:hypothetical protein
VPLTFTVFFSKLQDGQNEQTHVGEAELRRSLQHFFQRDSCDPRDLPPIQRYLFQGPFVSQSRHLKNLLAPHLHRRV